MRIEHRFEGGIFYFYLTDELKNKVKVDNWSDYENEFLSQFSILNTLRDNGQAIIDEFSCKVQIDEVYLLEELDRYILELPTDCNFPIYVQAIGDLSKQEFKYKFAFYNFLPNGSLFKQNLEIPFVVLNNIKFLLSPAQILLIDTINKYNDLDNSEKVKGVNLTRFAEIKNLSKNIKVVFDAYLASQSVYIPENVKIDLQFGNDTLKVFPSFDSVSTDEFAKVFMKYPARDDYPVKNILSGSIERIVLDNKNKSALATINKFREVKDPTLISEIVDNPEKFFDSYDIDYSIFYGSRVKEIGLYKPKYFPFVSPYKSDWIPGLARKDRIIGDIFIRINNYVELEQFELLLDDALNNEFEFVVWQEEEVPIEQAKFLAYFAKKQFQKPSIPYSDTSDEVPVLIIKDNAEISEIGSVFSDPQQLTFRFQKVDTFNDEYELKQYQIQGISWLQTMYKSNFSGCLLADDMGLGKTLQMLYFIEWHNSFQKSDKPYMIVAPVSLLENWENEYKRFFPQSTLSFIKLYGKVNLTRSFDRVINEREAASLQKRQIILTNYETLRNYQASLGLVDFALIALDEAQKIKTPGTLITNACKALKSDFKVAMTGTPVENSLIDLWCIMDFVAPGLLGNAKDFAKVNRVNEKLDSQGIKEVTSGVRSKINGFLIRRLKTDVAKELPEKVDIIVPKFMPAIQCERYFYELQNAQITNNGKNVGTKMLQAINAIRDVSDHPFLKEIDFIAQNSSLLIESSAKLQITIEIMRDIQQKSEKVIVFADRLLIQKMLQKVVNDLFGFMPCIINGDTPASLEKASKWDLTRQQTIDKFQSKDGFNIIIMSPLSAGVGLNVTGANHVIHYSRHWNPAKESQATDRAYRIGQTKNVYVYYPMAIIPENKLSESGERIKSFDEILEGLLNSKKQLASNTLFPTEMSLVQSDELFDKVFGFK